MTEVTLYYQDGILTGIQSKGHSGFARKGSDIICAAISVLMQSLLLGLEDIAQVENLGVKTDQRVPVISITWPKPEHERIALLTETIAGSLRQIAIENPLHVKILTEEN